MNFKNLVCGDCQKEDLNDSFLMIGLKNSNLLYKNNNADLNIKSIISTSDNNNSIDNNLEIIEYPYSNINSCNNSNNNGFIPQSLPGPLQSKMINKMDYNEYDNYFGKIKPPKLYNEENKGFQMFKKNKINHKIENIFNISNNAHNVNNVNNIERESSFNNNSIIINNEDNLKNNKAFLSNYNLTNNRNDHKNEEEQKIKNYTIINEQNNINHKNKFNNNINGIKIDYPCPDTDSFLGKKNKNNNNSLATKIQDNPIDVNYLLKDLHNQSQEIKNINNSKNVLKKLSNYINFQKLNHAVLNTKNNTDNEKYINNNYKMNNKICNKLFKRNHRNNNKNNLIKIKKNDKILKIKKKINSKNKSSPINKQTYSFKKLDDNVNNEYIGLKTENNHIGLSKTKPRYLSNAFISDLLFSKTNLINKNTLSNYNLKKKKEKSYKGKYYRPNNQNTIYTSKTYMNNPFLIKLETKKKLHNI